jgi:hypothetical protein
MNSGLACEYQPVAENSAVYETLYREYLRLGRFTEQPG